MTGNLPLVVRSNTMTFLIVIKTAINNTVVILKDILSYDEMRTNTLDCQRNRGE